MTITCFFPAAPQRAFFGSLLLTGLLMAQAPVEVGAIQSASVFGRSATLERTSSSLQSDLDQLSPITVQGPDLVNDALLNTSLRAGLLPAFFPEPPQSRSQPSALPDQAPAPKKTNWARRHAVLLTGLVMTGVGAGLVATGGPGQVSGCLAAGPYGSVECTTASTWGASGRHISGVVLLGAGLPVAIWGLIKH